MMLSAAQHLQASLSKCAASGWDTVSLITKVVSVWRDIDTALAPIIGHRGVAALFGRSLHLTRADYPCLTALHENTTDRINFAALQSTLSDQTSTDVVALNDALLRKFVELLSNLIGVSLVERLLRPVVDIHSTGDAA
jgi:hypothetical protein